MNIISYAAEHEYQSEKQRVDLKHGHIPTISFFPIITGVRFFVNSMSHLLWLSFRMDQVALQIISKYISLMIITGILRVDDQDN
jgi:hypothetical protein